MPIKLLLATQFPIITLGFEKLLSDSPEFKIVGKVDNQTSLMDVLKSSSPDVLILDLEMVKINSLNMIKRIHKYQNHDGKIICKEDSRACSSVLPR